MDIINSASISKLAKSQWSYFQNYSGNDAEKMTPVFRVNNTSLKLSIAITGTIPLDCTIVVRSYNSQGNSIFSDKEIFSRKWRYGDSSNIIVDFEADTNTVAIIFKNNDASRQTYGFANFNISASTSNNDDKKEFRKQKTVIHNEAGRPSGGTNTPWISPIQRIQSDKFYLVLRERTNVPELKIDLYSNFDGKNSYQNVYNVHNGSKRQAVSEPIYFPIVAPTKEFRVRLENITAGGTTLDVDNIEIIEVEEFDLELLSLYGLTANDNQILELSATVELRTQPIIGKMRWLHFENTSYYASININVGGIYKTLSPNEIFVIRNPANALLFTYQSNFGIGGLKFVGAKEKLYDAKTGIINDISVQNIINYQVLRPFPKVKNRVFATKSNPNQLWDVTFNDKMEVISEILLHTFDLPIIDVFVTYSTAILISTGEIYAAKGTVNNFKLYRSAPQNWGVTVTQIAISAKASWFPRLGIDQSGSFDIFFAEYSIIEESISVYRSSDDGVTWVPVFTKSSPDDIRHFHTLKVDYNNQRDIYISSGDAGTQIKWWKSSNNGDTWDLLDTKLGNFGKILGIECFPDYLIVVTDLPGFDNYILKVDKKDFSYKILAKTNQVFFGLVRSGRTLFAYTVTQHGANVMENMDYVNELFYSLDDGETWQIAWRWPARIADSNLGFRFASLPDLQGNIYLRTTKPGLEGHTLPYNSARISLKN